MTRCFYKLALRFRSLFRKKHAEQELSDELRFHLEKLIEERLAKGMTAEEARFAALRELGGVEQIKEQCRDMRRVSFIENFVQDARYGLRQLHCNSGFATVAVLTLALGIGANTAIFSLVDAVLLKMLPVKNPEQLVRLTWLTRNSGEEESFSYPTFKLLNDNNQTLSGVIAFHDLGNVDFAVHGHSELARGQAVSGNYFMTLGVEAITGRALLPSDDDIQGKSPVAVISYGYWTRLFNRNPSVVGTAITLNGASFTIIGVTPPEFFGLEPGESVDVSIPLAQASSVKPGWATLGSRYDVFSAPFRNWLRLMARLKDGEAKDRALANLQTIYVQAVRQAAEGARGLPFYSPQGEKELSKAKIRLEPGSRGLMALRRQFSKPLIFLTAVVGVLLLIACSNVANLLLARANSRQREIALRMALGARRLRVMSQLLTESLLLALGGGLLGTLLAFWGSSALLSLLSRARSPVHLTVKPDVNILAFTALVSLVAAIVFGLAPAWRMSSTKLSEAVKGGVQGVGSIRRHHWLGESLVVSQVALSLVLLVGAGLLVRTLEKLNELDPGFDRRNVLLFSVNPGMVGYNDSQVVGLYERLSEHIRATPGVRSLSFSIYSPLAGWSGFTDARVEGYTPRSGENPAVAVNFVGPSYFKTLGTAVLLGREFTDADRIGAPKVAVINEAMARHFFGNENPLGRRFSIPGWKGDASPLEIVGVVANTKLLDLRGQPAPVAYMPFLQAPDSVMAMTFAVRTASNPVSIAASIRKFIDQTNSRVPLFDVKTLTEQVNESLVEERLVASLSSLFGSIALFLTCVGLYGLMAYTVTRRTREIGIRMALGARMPEVVRMVLGRGMAMALIGVAVGLTGATGLTRLMASLLFGVKPTDVVAYLSGSLILVGVSALASYIPARRATKVDPLAALRYE